MSPEVVVDVTILETNRARGRAEREIYQQQMMARLDCMQDAIITLSNTVAGLTATIKEQGKWRQ